MNIMNPNATRAGSLLGVRSRTIALIRDVVHYS